MEGPPKIKSFLAVTKLLSKVQNVKKNWEKGMLVDHLCTIKYFERMIQDPIQRQEFIQTASSYMKCKFYPKGTVICHQGSNLSTVSIIVEGKAVVYGPKTSDEIQPKNHDLRRQNIIENYIEYIQKKIVKSCTSLTDTGLGSLSSRKYRPAFLKRKDAPPDSPPKGKGNFAEIVEKILIPKNPLLPEFLQESDLNTEEKLLLLAVHDQLDRYISHGELNMKPIASLNISDAIGSVSLVKSTASKQAVVASEDVFLVSMAREDLYFLYSLPELSNPREKIQFLEKIFPDMEEEYRMKLAFYLEERVYSSREIIYKEGGPSDAIYMVKHGEVEFTVYNKSNLSGTVSPLRHIDKLSPMNQAIKISTTNLQQGTIFGEEEIVYPTLRKSSAMARHANTFLFILRKEIYNDILAKYHPEIANAFKDWIEVKVSWRRDQFKDEDEDILDKKEALLRAKASPRLRSFENMADSISEKIKNRKNLLRIQSSVGLKLPVKAVPMLDLNSVATPRYQERRLKGLNLNRFENLVSTEDFRLYPKAGESLEDTSLKGSKLSAKPKDEPKETKSNLFLLNQQILTAKLKPSLRSKLLSKRGSMSGNTSQMTPRDTSSVTTDQGLMFELKKDLLQNMSGAQSARGPMVDSPKLGITMDKNLIKNKTLIMLKSYSKKKELPILKMSLDATPRIEHISNQEKIHTNSNSVNNNHRRFRSMGFHPNVKMTLPINTDSVLTGYKTTNSNGTAKKLLSLKG